MRSLQAVLPRLRGGFGEAQRHCFRQGDTEDQGQLAQAAGITSIPTIMGFRDGILVYQQAGALREDQLETVIGSIRELDMDKVRAEIAAAEGSAEKK